MTLESDKLEIEKLGLQEISKKDIERKLISINRKPEAYFRDAFNFANMGQEYEIRQTLALIKELEFDIFELDNSTDGNELFITLMHIMQKDDYIKEFNINFKKMRNFAYTVQANYNDVAYHNKTHAADICQT